jgi:hypothetical protein
MELNEQEKIDELLKLERDNNHMLHKMRRSMVWGNIFTLFYWLVILGGLGASYYYLQPYVMKYWNVYQSAVQTLESVQKTTSAIPTDINGLLKNYSK